MSIIFRLEGRDLYKSAVKLSTNISTYTVTQGASMTGVPSCTISNSGAWSNKTELRDYIVNIMKIAFQGKTADKRNKFGTDLAYYINKWFMDAANQVVVSVTIPGSPPTVIPGPATPNTSNLAKGVLKKDLIKIFTNIHTENYMTLNQARIRINKAIQDYFDSFKVGGEQVWTLSPVLGYLP